MAEKEMATEIADPWESGELGADEAHARRVSDEVANQINDSLGMRMISIRLNETLIDTFKLIGNFHGVGYQPLMRDALKRFANAELKAIVSGIVESQRNEKEQVKAKSATKVRQKPSSTKSRKAA